MAERNDQINKKIKMFLSRVEKKYHISDAYIFGSYAKGTFGKWSDIDLALISPDFSDESFDVRLELMKIASTIDDRIEPCPYKTDTFNIDDPLVAEIKKYGIRIM
ncbi:MAG: nucleotidyltransferase domain-containing protein [Deltaproteobacteria bacterium]|nr:nucleotidyltransferase domain-containing protein [Deltaproteobacteria bacterium]MBW1941082.1 nucleotidyltransferase domain-containing protein [Deltaproteobacteria bacterium]MBW2011326.1 nucleotidyltransferase domain-containing protein [Deltaproteobacteria bacterium]MBW2101005.1 nucleotidyltransferase domain-containing protein [Deltaproteobacteria bacterium]